MRKITISVDDDVYSRLHSVIGQGYISSFINELVKPHLIRAQLDESYKQMAADKNREIMANEWSENLLGDIGDF